MTVYNNNRDGKWEIVKNADADNYTVTYYEYYSACGWKKIGASETYSKEAAEYEFDINLDGTDAADDNKATTDNKEEMKMKKFEIGKNYVNPYTGVEITVTKRTAQFIYYMFQGRGVSVRSKIRDNGDGDEYITTSAKYMYFAKDEVTDEPAAPQQAANDEPATDNKEESNMKTYQVSFIVDGICQANMAIAENAESVEAYYRRECNGRGDVCAVREASEWEIAENRRRGMPFVTVPTDSSEPEQAETQQDAPDSAETEDSEAGQPATQETEARTEVAPIISAKRNPVAPYEIFKHHPESGTYLFANEGEAALIDALHFHADSENALSVVNALYEITHDGGGWFSPRNHPVMLDALNEYIGFLTAEIEVFDNFPNEMEKEIAVGKREEAEAIRDAFAYDATAAARKSA